jgi:hypothetical protein
VRYAIKPEEWKVIKIIIDFLEVSSLSTSLLGIYLFILQVFRNASTFISGEKYPTLSSSLALYGHIINHIEKFEADPETRLSPSLAMGLQQAKEKMFKFFDKSTAESEYYYFATGELTCNSGKRK